MVRPLRHTDKDGAPRAPTCVEARLGPEPSYEDIIVSASLVIDRSYSLASRTERSLKAARHFDICELRSSVCRIVRSAVQHQDGYLHAGSEVRKLPVSSCRKRGPQAAVDTEKN